jgi:Response regulators consisting of a CheY-like receiver domain and a winged-helix DNA-binding domain
VTHARILVAEDDPVTARFLTTLLSEKGYEVLLAEDGERAAELAANGRPDLIVCDVVMPYRDGFDLLREFRRDERLERIPVILLSMRDREEDIVHALESGADDYMVKPFNARELLARVRKQLLARRKA